MGLVTALSISSFEVKIGGAKDAYGLRGWAYEVKKKKLVGAIVLKRIDLEIGYSSGLVRVASVRGERGE